jgi:hypothetical protein
MRLPVVVLMQTAQYGARGDLPNHLWPSASRWLARDSLLYPLMGVGVVEVPLILFHQPIQMPLAQDQEVVQALTPHATQKSLTDGISLRRSIRGPQHLNPGPRSYPCEGSTILVVIVPNQISWSLPKWRRLAQLLSHPGIRWVPNHTEVHQASRAQLDNDEQEQRSEEYVIGLKEITCPARFGRWLRLAKDPNLRCSFRAIGADRCQSRSARRRDSKDPRPGRA